MAFAKLSGSLLESRDAPAVRALLQNDSEPGVAPGSEERAGPPADHDAIDEIIPGLIDDAHLYAELRDRVAANDQDGVARVFGELVRAGWPISEISGVVESLSSRLHDNEAPEANGSPLEEPPRQSAGFSFEQALPDATTDPSVTAETRRDDATAARPAPGNGDAVHGEWPQPGVGSELGDGAAAPAGQYAAWAVGPAPRLDSDGAGAVTALSEPEHAQVSDTPTAAACVRERSDYASTVAEGEPGDDNFDSHAVAPASPRQRLPLSRAPVAAALAAAVGILGAGIFLLMQPSARDSATRADRPSIASANLPAVEAAAAEHQPNPVVPRAGAIETPSQVAATPATLAPATPPAMIAPVVPDKRTSDRPEPKPAATAPEGLDGKVSANAASPVDGSGRAASLQPVAPAAPVGPADRAEPKAAVSSLEPPKHTAVSDRVGPDGSAPAAPPASHPVSERPKEPSTASVETASFLQRGDRLFGVGDIASARLFYERAADAGDSQAALRLGETYDPAFLQRAQLRVPGDRALAVFWYGRARELGADEAEILLKSMQTR
jgi:hypothetical protein